MRIEMKMIKEIKHKRKDERTDLVILISPRRQRKEERTKKFSLHAVSSIREELQIEFSQYEHPVVLTVEAQAKYVGNLGGALSKNLFLKDKKHRYYVVSALADTKVDLKANEEVWKLKMGLMRLSFSLLTWQWFLANTGSVFAEDTYCWLVVPATIY
ncbi:hypothetical protein ES288_D02G221800v1 [Gossypium darwinii]|uniref:YbaK/aminoacyl-tRNA synthetase-associated domain-containing protein n=2 Tax=Gossypium TaxID=3633 RepID=A0A5D2M0J3_GOSTO|nr:hypothetical protein ES288_D02G221800v1 [Gossypium darwinii]TYH84873.1 hypothetical protein ES332_D02G225400v1 [Gossypium tomentosum]